MIDFSPVFAQVLPYLWIPFLFISLAMLFKRMKGNPAQETPKTQEQQGAASKESSQSADK